MPSPLSQGQSFSVTAFPLFNKRHVFQESRILLPQLNCDVQFRVSVDAFRTFVGAIGGTEPDIADDNARDLGLLSDGFRLTAFLTPGADWRAAHPSPEADTGRIAASPDEPLPSHDRAICLLEERVGRLRQAAIEGWRAKVTAAAKDIHLAAEQRRALARKMRALEGEIGRLPEAIAAIGAKLKEGFVCVQQEADDSQRQSQKREAMADVRNVLGPLEAVVGENGRHVFAAVETPRVKKQLAVEFCGLKLRVGVLEQDNRRLSVVKKLRPQGQKAPSTSSDFGELTAVVGLRGG
jgi:hypothetical protein